MAVDIYEEIKTLPLPIQEMVKPMYREASRFYHFNYTENGNVWITEEAEVVYNTIITGIKNKITFWKQ